MPRVSLRVVVFAVILSAWTLQASDAQDIRNGAAPLLQAAPRRVHWPASSNAKVGAPIQRVGNISTPAQLAHSPKDPPRHIRSSEVVQGTVWSGTPNVACHQYPNLHAPLYPTPKPNIPYQTGATIITNQALAPHEMLYPHSYRAMYPPFYYSVWSLDHCPKGTVVKVKYRSYISPLAKFIPPAIW